MVGGAVADGQGGIELQAHGRKAEESESRQFRQIPYAVEGVKRL